jgi:hypothetical protein
VVFFLTILASNPCNDGNNGGCSQICLYDGNTGTASCICGANALPLAPDSPTCLCNLGFELDVISLECQRKVFFRSSSKILQKKATNLQNFGESPNFFNFYQAINPCDTNNGGCTDICLYAGPGKSTCQCNDNQNTIQVDNDCACVTGYTKDQSGVCQGKEGKRKRSKEGGVSARGN